LRSRYDESVAAKLDFAMHRVTASLMHTPTLRAQELARAGNGPGYLAALHTIFGIEP
jgi:glutamyl-tRNA reductase